MPAPSAPSIAAVGSPPAARPRVFIVDNYDSFTYNIAQELGELGAEVEVARHDAFRLSDLDAWEPAGIVISPGPGTPADAGLSNDVIRHAQGRVPVLGVCLGHQCIAELYGGRVVRADELLHGKTSLIHHDGAGVFTGLPQPFDATRYHSLVVEPDSVPDVLAVSARSDRGLIMGLRHRQVAVEGVQFHPESILTTAGMDLLANFLRALRPPPGMREAASPPTD